MPDDGLMTTAEVLERSAVGPASGVCAGGVWAGRSFGGNRDSGRLGAVRVPAPHRPGPRGPAATPLMLAGECAWSRLPPRPRPDGWGRSATERQCAHAWPLR